MMSTLQLLGLATAALAQPDVPPPDCQAAIRAVPGKACIANPAGVVLADTQAEAERLAGSLRQGEARFARHFGRSPPLYAVAQGMEAGGQRALTEAGFGRVLPWLTVAEFEALALGSVRQGTQASATAQGLDAARSQAAVDEAVATWRSRNTLAQIHARDAGVVPHEAGHGWYVEAFWPGLQVERRGHYGGPGPDWLDETAAVLLESDAFAVDRRTGFEQVYRGSGSGMLAGMAAAELIDLPLFLHRDHPASGRSFTTSGPPPREGANIRVLAGEEARAIARTGLQFYLQARVFADFLIEATGDPAVFASIGQAFGAGRTIEQWLAEHGRDRQLGANVAQLDATWRAWLHARYGPPADTPEGTPGA